MTGMYAGGILFLPDGTVYAPPTARPGARPSVDVSFASASRLASVWKYVVNHFGPLTHQHELDFFTNDGGERLSIRDFGSVITLIASGHHHTVLAVPLTPDFDPMKFFKCLIRKLDALEVMNRVNGENMIVNMIDSRLLYSEGTYQNNKIYINIGKMLVQKTVVRNMQKLTISEPIVEMDKPSILLAAVTVANS